MTKEKSITGGEVDALRLTYFEHCVQNGLQHGYETDQLLDYLASRGHITTTAAISTQRGESQEIAKMIKEAHTLMTEPTEDGLHIMRAEFKLGKALSLLNPALTSKPETVGQEREGLGIIRDALLGKLTYLGGEPVRYLLPEKREAALAIIDMLMGGEG